MDSSDVAGLADYVARWGVSAGERSVSVHEFSAETVALRAALRLLYLTESEQVASVEQLVPVWRAADGWDETQSERAAHLAADPDLAAVAEFAKWGRDEMVQAASSADGVPSWEVWEKIRTPISLDVLKAKSDAWAQRWRAFRQRDARDGEPAQLAYQRRLLAAFIQCRLSPSGSRTLSSERVRVAWNGGRRVYEVAVGTRELETLTLRDLFGAALLDVYLCSECERPYEFLEEEGKRRPQRGRARFCSDACRQEANRRRVREAWHANKERYRPARAQA